MDEKGSPIPGAAVEPVGFRKGERGRFGGMKGFDPLALSNGKGEFGRVNGDTSGVRLPLDAGDRTPPPDFNKEPKLYEEYKRLKDSPLRGAEGRP